MMNKYTFIPDVFNRRKKFESEGENCVDAIQKVENYRDLSNAFAVYKVVPYGKKYIGQIMIFGGIVKFFKPISGLGLLRSEAE